MGNIFITGGTGFIGGHLIRRLLDGGNKIWCLTRHRNGHFQNNQSIEWIEADLTDTESYKKSLEGADYVFHLAGVISSRRKEEYIRTNVLGTEALLEACRDVNSPQERFVFMSSIAAMGANSEGKLLRESDPCFPQSEYGISKLQAEQIVARYSDTIPTVILRPSFIYGRGDFRGLKQLRSIFSKSGLTWASFIQSISVCHVSDVIQGCLLAMVKDVNSGEIFIISDSEVHTWRRIKEALIEVINDILTNDSPKRDQLTASFLEYVSILDIPSPKMENMQFWGCDISKAKAILNFQPEISLRKGAYDTIHWYLDEGLLILKNLKL